MQKLILLVAMLLATPVQAEELPRPVNSLGYTTLSWVFTKTDDDLYDRWAKDDDDTKLKGSVADYMDWKNVSRITALYNAWHLPLSKDIRVQHLEKNLKQASFGDRFKGTNPGGAYVFLMEYRESERQVLLSFKDGLFFVECDRQIGVVDIRGEPK